MKYVTKNLNLLILYEFNDTKIVEMELFFELYL